MKKLVYFILITLIVMTSCSRQTEPDLGDGADEADTGDTMQPTDTVIEGIEEVENVNVDDLDPELDNLEQDLNNW